MTANSLTKKNALQSAANWTLKWSIAKTFFGSWHGHKKKRSIYSMVCPEMVRCYTLLKREFSTCRRRGPRSAGPDEQTLQQRNLQAPTHPCWVGAQGTRYRPAYDHDQIDEIKFRIGLCRS